MTSAQSELIKRDLFYRVLVEPVKVTEADTLMVVSGYATASMADRHLHNLSDVGNKIDLRLIVGMSMKDGIERAQHAALKKLVQNGSFGSRVQCSYVTKGNPVHAKTYVWMNDREPVSAFAGSANYTLTGFGQSQVDTMAVVDPRAALDFYNECLENTISCDVEDVENNVVITETRKIGRHPSAMPEENQTVTLSLLVSSTGETHTRAGLNWGQRPGRERNQAYIPVPMDIARQEFFPDIGIPFTVLTDDGFSFIFVRAQQGGKALHTTESNSTVGEYLRTRIGMPLGEYVTRTHLVEYGRTDVTMTKIDEETFLLDFRPNFGPGEDAELWEQ